MAKDYLSIAPVQQFDPTACWAAALQWWARAIGGRTVVRQIDLLNLYVRFWDSSGDPDTNPNYGTISRAGLISVIGGSRWRPHRGPATRSAESLRPILGFVGRSRHQPKLRNHFARGPDLGYRGFPLGHDGVRHAGRRADDRAVEPKDGFGASDSGLLRAGGQRKSRGGGLWRLRNARRRDESGRSPLRWPARGPLLAVLRGDPRHPDALVR